MPGSNNPVMLIAADAMKAAMRFAQLHTASAGAGGTLNVTTAARKVIPWAPTTGDGDFGLASPLIFTGGASNGPVYSVTMWSAITGGTFYGELILTGDATFNAAGQYIVLAMPFDGSASWSGLQPYDDFSAARGRVLPNPGKKTYPVLRTIRRVQSSTRKG